MAIPAGLPGLRRIALACILSTPVIFIAGPLLLFDAVRLALRRTLGAQMVGAVGAGLVVLAHLVVFVLPQSALRSSPYWDPQFLPHDGIGHQVTFVWDNVRGFVTGVFTASAQSNHPGFLLTPGRVQALSVVFGLLLCVGVFEAARSAHGRTILFAIVASQVLALVASYLRYWPFGFVRTNFYLIPLLMLLAGIGGFCTCRYGLSLVRGPEAPPDPTRRHGVLVVVGVALCALVGAGVTLAATGEVGTYRQTRGSNAGYGSKIGSVVATVRTRAQPGAAVVVAGGVMTTPGWRYYQYEYRGEGDGRRPPDRRGPHRLPGDPRFCGHHRARGPPRPSAGLPLRPGRNDRVGAGSRHRGHRQGPRVPAGVDHQVRRERGADRPLLLAALSVGREC